MESNYQSEKAKRERIVHRKFIRKKRTAAFSRWLHNYLSMLSFLIVLFFAVTGITLNHAEWFGGKEVEKKYQGTIPVAWVNTADTTQIKKLEIVEWLRRQYSIKGYVSDFVIEEDRCSVSFKGPGYSADAFINRSDGTFQLSELRFGLIAVLNDLHKGRDSGKGWSWLIDISAGLLTIVALSGLLMMFFLKKKRVDGFLLLLAGGIICLLIYWICVP